MLVKKIEDKIKLVLTALVLICISCVTICGMVLYYSHVRDIESRKSIYLLDHDVPILAKQTDQQANRPVEYKAHVDLFHSIFFSLTPDDKQIDYQTKKAFYLIDESGANEYNNLKERGFYSSIVSTNSVLTLQTDSIKLDIPNKYFRYYGKQTIERRSSKLIKSIITEGKLMDVPRSENNPHGILITNWKTLQSKTIDNVQKNIL